ncbi:MAG TPA: alkylmercury lyase [Candidatus Dormibacteraeota bacterium]|jgi:hypothetical protein|nr:alkylmercury lyase [Candidatus Dormibacteraeota bacterium]
MSAEVCVARIEILHLPDCPLVDRVRESLHRVLSTASVRSEITEHVGNYPSPTLLVDGRDVTGRPLGEFGVCRLDLPSDEQILAALRGDRR